MFSRNLGMDVTDEQMFYRVMKEVYPCITAMFDEVCELGKEEMKVLKANQFGSWKRAVTTSDGCWHILFFFAKCHICYLQLAVRGIAVVWPCLHEGIQSSLEGLTISRNSKVN